jgi:hypothetical protein
MLVFQRNLHVKYIRCTIKHLGLCYKLSFDIGSDNKNLVAKIASEHFRIFPRHDKKVRLIVGHKIALNSLTMIRHQTKKNRRKFETSIFLFFPV